MSPVATISPDTNSEERFAPTSNTAEPFYENSFPSAILITSSPESTKLVFGTRLAVAVDFIETLDAIYNRLCCSKFTLSFRISFFDTIDRCEPFACI